MYSQLGVGPLASPKLVYYQLSSTWKNIDYCHSLHHIVNVRPAFFYTKPFVYNSAGIYLIMIKL